MKIKILFLQIILYFALLTSNGFCDHIQVEFDKQSAPKFLDAMLESVDKFHKILKGNFGKHFDGSGIFKSKEMLDHLHEFTQPEHSKYACVELAFINLRKKLNKTNSSGMKNEDALNLFFLRALFELYYGFIEMFEKEKPVFDLLDKYHCKIKGNSGNRLSASSASTTCDLKKVANGMKEKIVENIKSVQSHLFSSKHPEKDEYMKLESSLIKGKFQINFGGLFGGMEVLKIYNDSKYHVLAIKGDEAQRFDPGVDARLNFEFPMEIVLNDRNKFFLYDLGDWKLNVLVLNNFWAVGQLLYWQDDDRGTHGEYDVRLTDDKYGRPQTWFQLDFHGWVWDDFEFSFTGYKNGGGSG